MVNDPNIKIASSEPMSIRGLASLVFQGEREVGGAMMEQNMLLKMNLEKAPNSDLFNIKNLCTNFDRAEPTSDKGNSKDLTQVRPIKAAYIVKSCSSDSANVPGGNSSSPFLAYKELSSQIDPLRIISTMPVDGTTIANQTHGKEVVLISYTPMSASSSLLIRVESFLYQCDGALNTLAHYFRTKVMCPRV